MGTLEDYHIKVRTLTFNQFFTLYVIENPMENVGGLNNALCHDVTKMELIARLPPGATFYNYLQMTTGIPLDILEILIPPGSLTKKLVYAAVCAVEMTLRHLSPLLVLTKENPEVFFEYMAFFNHIWVIGRLGEFQRDHCDEGRALYNITQLTMGHNDPDQGPGSSDILTNHIRSQLGLKPIATRALKDGYSMAHLLNKFMCD